MTKSKTQIEVVNVCLQQWKGWTLFLFSVRITVAACCVLSAEIIISKLVALQVYRCCLKKISLKMKKKNVFNVSKNFLTSFYKYSLSNDFSVAKFQSFLPFLKKCYNKYIVIINYFVYSYHMFLKIQTVSWKLVYFLAF